MEKIFEKAIKEKIRFDYNGVISVEDLYDLDVNKLDGIYKQLSVEKKNLSEDSLLDSKNTESTILDTKIEIITYIVKSKLEEDKKNKELANKKLQKEKLMSILAKKQDNELEGKTVEELKEMINSL